MGAERPTSVLYGRDPEAISRILHTHHPTATDILDATFNTGVMWKKAEFQPTVTLDVNPESGAQVIGDCRAMPFRDASFDVVAFDPPHLPAAAASPGSSGIQRERYGLTEHGDYRQGDNVSPLFVPFLLEAKRVLRPDGIVIAKIADLVHNHRYQWQHVDFINAVREVGMTPCDGLIKADPAAANLKSSKWKNVKHLRRAHCFWIVVRNSRSCERKG